MFTKFQHKIEGIATILLGVVLLITFWIDPDMLKDVIKGLQRMPKPGKIFLTILSVFLIWIGLKD